MPVDETVSRGYLQRFLCFAGAKVAAWSSRGRQEETLVSKSLFSTPLTMFLEKFKLWCNYRGHSSGNGRKPLLSRGFLKKYIKSWVAETLTEALGCTSFHEL